MICSDVLAESGELNILFEKRPDIMINDSETEPSTELHHCFYFGVVMQIFVLSSILVSFT